MFHRIILGILSLTLLTMAVYAHGRDPRLALFDPGKLTLPGTNYVINNWDKLNILVRHGDPGDGFNTYRLAYYIKEDEEKNVTLTDVATDIIWSSVYRPWRYVSLPPDPMNLTVTPLNEGEEMSRALSTLSDESFEEVVFSDDDESRFNKLWEAFREKLEELIPKVRVFSFEAGVDDHGHGFWQQGLVLVDTKNREVLVLSREWSSP